MEILTLKHARAQGMKHYYTGKPCKNGHLCGRFASDKSCVQCRREKGVEWQKQHHEKSKGYYAKHNAKRKEAQREYRQIPDVKKRAFERNKEWQKANRERCREYTKRWCLRNADHLMAYRERPEVKAKVKEACTRWRMRHPERVGLWAKRNPEKRRAINGRRYAKMKSATVPWADQAKIAAIYTEAERLTKETGIPHEVDHIYPIQGRTVCGLHHEANLRVVPRSVNRAKGNRLNEEAA